MYSVFCMLINLDEHLKLKNRTDRKRPRKRRNYDPEVTSTKHVYVNQFAEGWNNWKRRTDQEILSNRQINLANPVEEFFKLCNQEISQLRVSIELDKEIFDTNTYAELRRLL